MKNKNEIINVSGPVIIENGKILLVKDKDDPFWKFPGGTCLPDEDVRGTCQREVKEELGIKIEITGEPIILSLNKDKKNVQLYHFRSQRINQDIVPGQDIKEYAWHSLKKLPDNLVPNVIPILNEISK